jgi:hypothetical protein
MYIERLSENVDRREVAREVRVIMTLHLAEDQVTYRFIADFVEKVGYNVEPDALRLFVTGKEAGRVNVNNKSLAALYSYIVKRHHHFCDNAKRRYYTSLKELGMYAQETPVDDASFALGTQGWVSASSREITGLAEKITGNFIALRKSTIGSNIIMKSRLSVSLRRSGNSPFIHATHEHFDRTGRLRTSVGFIVPVRTNIYGAMQIEGHEGLEIFTLRDPMQHMPEFFMGFMLGVNGNRNIYNSSLLLERESGPLSGVWSELPHRFKHDNEKLKRLGKDFQRRLEEVLYEERSRTISGFEKVEEIDGEDG